MKQNLEHRNKAATRHYSLADDPKDEKDLNDLDDDSILVDAKPGESKEKVATDCIYTAEQTQAGEDMSKYAFEDYQIVKKIG